MDGEIMIQFIINFLNALQGLRKTVVMGILIVLAVVFRIKGLISGDNMVQLLQGTTIAFFTANGLEHMTSTVKEYIGANGKKISDRDTATRVDKDT